jgi:hypothetical protein
MPYLDVFGFIPKTALNGLILNWCIGGCWFTPASDEGRGWQWDAGNGNRMKFNGEVSPVVEIVAQFAWAFNFGLSIEIFVQ